MRHRFKPWIASSVAVATAASIAGAIAFTSSTANAATTTFTPTADTYVSNSSPGTGYGTSGQLGVDNSPIKRMFLKFSVSGLTEAVTTAKLRIHVDDVSGAASSNGGTFKR